MHKRAIDKTLSLSADLKTIVANASFLWERLDTKRFIADIDPVNEQEICRRLDRWCQVVAQGNWGTLQKRLQWEGIDLDIVYPRLGTVELAVDQLVPEWGWLLQQIVRIAQGFKPETDTLQPIDPQNPIPFEDILLPIVYVARKQLIAHFDCLQLTEDTLPLSLLSKEAYLALEQDLMQHISTICVKTLNFEFSQCLLLDQNLVNLSELNQDKNNRVHYMNFVNRLLEDGLLSFFQTYPVLGRLVATAVHFWVESTTELLERLVADQEAIQETFQSKAGCLGKVTTLHISLADLHNCGRSVIVLMFESGLKLVYKPRDLGLEVAFQQFLDWCNHHSQLLDFKVMQMLKRDSYGWVEYIEHRPCPDEAAVERFYQRAGMLLCVLYALRGTDCHHENFIASGEHLLLIDIEALLQHDATPLDNSLDVSAFETRAGRQLWDSVLRTGLLPQWHFSGNRQVAYDISGLGSTDFQQTPQKVSRWQCINTDAMHLRQELVTLPLQKNVPHLGETVLSANDYQAQIAQGFEQTYHFILANNDLLMSSESPLTAMQDQHVRFIFRSTRIYKIILQKTWAPDYLKNGADYSIELDLLSRAFLVPQDRPKAWSILHAELRAIEQLDIPFFKANTSSDALRVHGGLSIPHYFKFPSYHHMLSQLQSLNVTDLTRQLAIIRGAFEAKMAQTTSEDNQSWTGKSLPLLRSGSLIEEATAIAAALESRAITDADGSINWIGLGYVPEAERYRLQILDESLYEGRCGVAVFFAALHQATHHPRFHDLTLRTLQRLRQQIRTIGIEGRQYRARLMGIGGAVGLGSMIYALVKASQFLSDEHLLQDAQALADWITPELIAADNKLDIISGSAGTILGLLSLYKATGTKDVLTKATMCGQHLLAQQCSYEGSPKAWRTLWEKPIAGFSHGVAGISYTLLRLYAVTQDSHYLEAAQEGIQYERSLFSESNANWHDLRRCGTTGLPSFPVKWCHGAAGIGLGRLGSLKIIDTPEIEREIEIALQTTQNYGLQAIDHLCCGNMGRVEVLLVGAQRCLRDAWHRVALQNATNVVAKAKQSGAYQLFPNLPGAVFNPGFFQGLAGIGYQLLRLANIDLPCVLLWE